MKVETLLRNFEILVEAPGGIDRLREIILSLAVQGRLLSGWDGEFDTENGLPSKWKLQRLDEVCTYIQRGKGPKYVEKSSCVVISQKCVQWTGFDISKARFVDEESLKAYGDERILRNGDILWNSTGTGTVGRTAIFSDSFRYKKVVADSHVTVLRAPHMDARFLWCWTASPEIQSRIKELTSGTTNQQELNLSSIKSLMLPVPPLQEQVRIAAIVDELMALCDQLERQQKQRDNLCIAARRSAIDAISTAASPEELKTAWKRIDDNWEVIADTSESIDSMRSMILGLAVKGRLFRDTDLTKWQTDVTLKDLGVMIRGITYAKSESSKEPTPNSVPLLGAANIQRSINYEGLTFVASSLIKPFQYLKDGDVLICMSSGSKHLVGKAGIVKNPPTSSFGAFCGVFRISNENDRDYLAMFFKSPIYRTAIAAASRGIGINNLRVGDIESIGLSLPPLSEQKRIVAKVDEFMALCDGLEELMIKGDEMQKRFVDLVTASTSS